MGTLGTKCFLLKLGLASRLCWTTQGCVLIRVEDKLPILSSHVGAESPNSKTYIEQCANQSRFELVHETICSRDHHYPYTMNCHSPLRNMVLGDHWNFATGLSHCTMQRIALFG